MVTSTPLLSTLVKKHVPKWIVQSRRLRLAKSTSKSTVCQSSSVFSWLACLSWSCVSTDFKADGTSTFSASSSCSQPLSLSRWELTSIWPKCTTLTAYTKMRRWRTRSPATRRFQRSSAASSSCWLTKLAHWLRMTWFSKRCQWSGLSSILSHSKICRRCLKKTAKMAV